MNQLISQQLNSQQIWEKTLRIIAEGISKVSYNSWFPELTPLELNNNTLILGTKNPLSTSAPLTMYGDYIKKCLESACGVPLDIKIILLEENTKSSSKSAEALPNNYEISQNSVQKEVLLDPKYTFDQFVVGTNNELANAAAMAVAENPATKYNPLLIYGETGLGKTHLMHSIGNYIKENRPDWSIVCVTSEAFTNELVNAIHKKTNVAFREKYRNTDLLMVDDIQFFAGKERTQEEFFHTFNELRNKGKQIVLSSDRPPKDIHPLEERLKTRIEGGLMADIQAPDYETRLAILNKKLLLNEFHVELPAEVLDLIASQIKTNIRELEGAVKKLIVYHEISHKEIDLNLANTILRDYLSTIKKQHIDATTVISAVEQYFHLSNSDIKSAKRDRKTAYPRQIAMYICRELTDLSLPQIGNAFGGRDHSTVLHSIKKIKAEIDISLESLNTINKLIEMIRQ